MKNIFLMMLALPLLFLEACKKDSFKYADLSISGFGPVAFGTGDAVSIYGTGFDTVADNNIVSFNGVPGEVANASPNRLQVIVPLLTTSGKITVGTHGRTVTSTQTYSIVNVLQGIYNDNFIMTADKRYLLRGKVVFNSKLIIEPGTIIYGEKLTHASLTVKDIDWRGTADKPIVFTSDQAPGSRQPGDWTGITAIPVYDLSTPTASIPLGIIQYVRVEYAGYHPATTRGSALNLFVDATSVCRYIQTSYSAGDGFLLTGGSGFIEHIVSLACWGDDFRITGSNLRAQYGLGLKDPYFADAFRSNGIEIASPFSSISLYLLSNFTLVGYNPPARKISLESSLTSNAGSGIKIGDFLGPNNQGVPITMTTTDFFAIYNSVVAGSWQAGVSLYGTGAFSSGTNWDFFEQDIYNSYTRNITLRNNFIPGTASASIPFRGGVFAKEGVPTYSTGFVDIGTSPQLIKFSGYNDTTALLDLIQGKDDLGIGGLTDYKNLNHPSVLPAAGSPLLNAASFPAGTFASDPLLNKDVPYAGAFGTVDWTAGWCNFNPQVTAY